MISERMIANAEKYAWPDSASDHAPTAIPGLTIYSALRPAASMPALFEPRFYVLLQGAKRMTIAGQDMIVRSGDCAISTLGLPFHTEVVEASPAKPYLGVAFAIDAATVADLLLAMPGGTDEEAPAFMSGTLTDEVAETVGRLLGLLAEPADIPVLAPLFERELAYRLAKGPMGGTLRRVAERRTRFDKVRTAAEWIRAHADEPMRVEALASWVGMSTTSLHRHFRTITGTSPLAYQRHIRLLAAREQIIRNGLSVTKAAFGSGYASASQFSREYKQMFGVAPMQDRPGTRRQYAARGNSEPWCIAATTDLPRAPRLRNLVSENATGASET